MALSPRGGKAKGSSYERELAAYMNVHVGLSARRALLSGGGRNDGGADLDGTPLIHIEAKRTETFAPYAAIQQAEESIKRGARLAIPVVMQRRNNVPTGKGLVVMRMDDWLKLYAAFLREQGVTLHPGDNSGFLALLDASNDGIQSAFNQTTVAHSHRGT
jgi:hypothetical protein